MKAGTFTWLSGKTDRLLRLERASANKEMFISAAQLLGVVPSSAAHQDDRVDWLEVMLDTPEDRLMSGVHHWCKASNYDWETVSVRELRSLIHGMSKKDLMSVHEDMLIASCHGMSGLPDEVRNVDPLRLIERLTHEDGDGNLKLKGATVLPSVFIGSCQCCTTDHRLQLLAALNSPKKGDPNFADRLNPEARLDRVIQMGAVLKQADRHKSAKGKGKEKRKLRLNRPVRQAIASLEETEILQAAAEKGMIDPILSALDWRKQVVLQLVGIPSFRVTSKGVMVSHSVAPVCKSCVANLMKPGGKHSLALRNVRTFARYMNPGFSNKGQGAGTVNIRSDIESFMRDVNDKCKKVDRLLKTLDMGSDSSGKKGIISSPEYIARNIADPAYEDELCKELLTVLDKESARAAINRVGRGKMSKLKLNIPLEQARHILERAKGKSSAKSGFEAMGGVVDEEE